MRNGKSPSHAMPELPEIITPEQLAAYLGISIRAVYAALRREEVPHQRVGRRFLIVKSRLEEWLKR